MFTRPHDLPDAIIARTLVAHWGFEVADVSYQPVGFGSHHWLAVADDGDARFVTVDDLDRNGATTPLGTADASFDRFAHAFRAAHAVGTEGGLSFVVTPLVNRQGDVVSRLSERYSMVVHHYVEGIPAGDNGEFRSAADRMAVVDCLVALHGASDVAAPHADVEQGFLPWREELSAALEDVGGEWSSGPFGEPARALLQRRAAGVRRMLAHYDLLVPDVCADRRAMVFTHGEPHASNVVLGASGPVLVDWESALIAPPERDLYGLDTGDGAAFAAYTAATGVVLRGERLDFYRLGYDLFEVGGYIALFRAAHTFTDDTAESWRNLVDFLRPEARWPALFA